MAHHLTETAVYTIATPERLVHACESGEPIFEKKRWVKAEALYESRQAGAELPLLLSNSRDCSWLITWTLLTTIKVSDAGTAFTIGSLYQLPRVRPQAIARYPSRERIAERYQRNYVICFTPKFVFEAAKSPQYWPGIKAVKREVREGEQRLALHVKRERNQSIVRELKAARCARIEVAFRAKYVASTSRKPTARWGTGSQRRTIVSLSGAHQQAAERQGRRTSLLSARTATECFTVGRSSRASSRFESESGCESDAWCRCEPWRP